MSQASLREELAQYRGAPQCMDCKWKLGTDITDNCSCRGNLTDDQKAKHTAAFNRARELQTLLEPQTPGPVEPQLR